jgi:hypothetical protein
MAITPEAIRATPSSTVIAWSGQLAQWQSLAVLQITRE